MSDVSRAQRIKRRAREVWQETEGQPAFVRVADLGYRSLRQIVRNAVWIALRLVDIASRVLLFPILNRLLVPMRRGVKFPDSVLHISYMVHIPYETTRILRRQGIKADYLAVGMKSPWWDKFDYHFFATGGLRHWSEFLFFWRVVARYEVLHSHFGIMLSTNGWELPVLRRLGRAIVVNYRGCEVRDPVRNQTLHPQMNICQDCDYKGSVCRDGKKRVTLANRFGHEFLVTTPDMRDFLPAAQHFPFFTPDEEPVDFTARPRGDRPFKIVHATNHPGIEGTERISRAIESLRRKGYAIDFVFLKGVTPEAVREAFRDADLSIGKMKMGYYANAQIESMTLGVPAVTWVRPEFMTEEIAQSGLIISHLDDLEATIERLIRDPAELEAKRRIARESILSIHDNDKLGQRLQQIYRAAIARAASS